MQHCFSSGLRLNDHMSNLFLTIFITQHMFQVIKYSRKARGQRSKSVFLVLPPDTIQNNPTSIISRVVIFFGFYSLCYRIAGSTSSLLARQSQRFKKNIIAHIYKIMTKIELCGVACAFVQISERGPRSKKFGRGRWTRSARDGRGPRHAGTPPATPLLASTAAAINNRNDVFV